MNKIKLKNVTLLGIDCVDIKRLILAAEICQRHFDFAEVKLLTSLPARNKNVIKIPKIKSVEAYSRFIFEKLDRYVNTSHVLIFQYDGFILNHRAWDNKFLKYDYIGAPWHVGKWRRKNFLFPKNLVGQQVVGNGGFSLRSKKLTALCFKLAKENKIKKIHPEDVAIGVYNRKLLEKHGVKFAPVSVAKKFSLEGNDIIGVIWKNQFGFHGLRWTDISNWLKKNPQYKINNNLDSWAMDLRAQLRR